MNDNEVRMAKLAAGDVFLVAPAGRLGEALLNDNEGRMAKLTAPDVFILTSRTRQGPLRTSAFHLPKEDRGAASHL
jgi:hypothetical protein